LTLSERAQRVFRDIDAFNAQDPVQESVQGVSRPHEQLYAERLSAWIEKLAPEASEELRIAARGQHIGRWTLPRQKYPMDRSGYLRWREELKRFHAETVGSILQKNGYPEEAIARVRALILKKNVRTDAEAQTLEDAVCLVFLETQFEDMRRKTPPEKLIEILRKTWVKMSPAGQAAALALPLPAEHRALIDAALRTP
jgi:hypothetical protein